MRQQRMNLAERGVLAADAGHGRAVTEYPRGNASQEGRRRRRFSARNARREMLVTAAGDVDV